MVVPKKKKKKEMYTVLRKLAKMMKKNFKEINYEV